MKAGSGDELAARRAAQAPSERTSVLGADEELLALARDRVLAELAAGGGPGEQELDPRVAELEAREAAVAKERELLVRAARERAEASVRLEQLARELRVREESLRPHEVAAAERTAELEVERRRVAAEARAVSERQADLEDRASSLDEREQSLAQEAKRQSDGYGQAVADLAAREARLAELAETAASERRLLAAAIEERAEAGARLEAVARELREREAQLAQRETATAAREAQLAERERDFAARLEELAEERRQFGEQQRQQAPKAGITADLTQRAATAARPVSASIAPAAWNLHALERVVRERSGEFPMLAEEWFAYLIALREVADSTGALPRSLHPLLNEVFAPIAKQTATSRRSNPRPR